MGVQISDFYEKSDTLPCSRIEADGVPFDRLLLKRSPVYRSTRVLARRLGIRLVPEVSSVSRGMTVFDPRDNHVIYTPIDQELRWTVEKIGDRKGDLQLKCDQLETLRGFVTSVFHDLNHRILYRTLVPTKAEKSFESVKFYLAMVESLAMIRDVQLSSDLGPMSSPLMWLNVIYKSFKTPVLEGALQFEDFRRILTFLYANNLGYSAAGYKRLRSKAEKSSAEFPAFSHFYKGPLRKTVRPWLSEYQKKIEGKFELPPPTEKALVFTMRPMPPSALMESDAMLRGLFSFFQGLFGVQ